jgi:hypothetical protein
MLSVGPQNPTLTNPEISVASRKSVNERAAPQYSLVFTHNDNRPDWRASLGSYERDYFRRTDHVTWRFSRITCTSRRLRCRRNREVLDTRSVGHAHPS